MKHVIYRTEYFDHSGKVLRTEEYDAFFNTFPDDTEALDIAAQPPIGCRLLLPKLVAGKLTEEDWLAFAAKKPGYQLKYASRYDLNADQYAIYAIYEKLFEDDGPFEPYLVRVLIGGSKDLTLDMCVEPLDYDLGDIHITRWEAIGPDAEGKGINIVASSNPANDREVQVHYGDWTISGRWESMAQIAPFEFVYHCRNSLFRFDVIFNVERFSQVIDSI